MSFVSQFSIRLATLEEAFVEYYMETYKKSKAEIIRTMISKYVNADKSFNPDRFLRFVKKELVDRVDDDDTAAELLQVAKDYATTRRQSDGPTLSGGRRKKTAR